MRRTFGGDNYFWDVDIGPIIGPDRREALHALHISRGDSPPFSASTTCSKNHWVGGGTAAAAGEVEVSPNYKPFPTD